jgi:hypothetical protein
MRKSFRSQMDLFVTADRAAELTGTERQIAVALLQALLTEVAMTLSSDPSTSSKGELGNE